MNQELENIKGKVLLIILGIIVVGVLFSLVGYFVGSRSGYESGWQAGNNEGIETGRATCDLSAKDSVSNPLDNMPTANPFEESVNPFE
jgi:hypothetical protein